MLRLLPEALVLPLDVLLPLDELLYELERERRLGRSLGPSRGGESWRRLHLGATCVQPLGQQQMFTGSPAHMLPNLVLMKGHTRRLSLLTSTERTINWHLERQAPVGQAPQTCLLISIECIKAGQPS